MNRKARILAIVLTGQLSVSHEAVRASRTLPALFTLVSCAWSMVPAARAGVWVAWQVVGRMYGLEMLAGLPVSIALVLVASGAGWVVGRMLHRRFTYLLTIAGFLTRE
jgi:hypothetical protein